MLSILIPTYNYNVFPLVLELHEQCKRCEIEFEIIVLDDCSYEIYQTQNKAIISISNCFYEVNSKNLGRTKTRQILAEKAQFNWVLFLDSDVIPAKKAFIRNYIGCFKERQTVFFGGYKYENELSDLSKTLRYNYGKEREEQTFEIRKANPYQFVLSGNLLIQKETFLDLNFNEDEKFYGMDIFFAYQLYIQKIKVEQIDNPIIHLGLESNEVFFKKSLQSVESRRQLLADKPEIDKLNSLLGYYNTIRKYKLTSLVKFFFNLSEKYLKRAVLREKPNLFCFDLYRLGYICSIK